MFLLLPLLNQHVVSGLNSTSSVQYLAIICIGFSKKKSESCCSPDLGISSSDFEQIIFCLFFLFLLLVMNSVQLSPVLSQSTTDCTNHDIRCYMFVSRYSGFIIIEFDEVTDMPCWQLLCFWHNLFPVHIFEQATSYLHCCPYFMPLRFPYAFVNCWAAPTCAKLPLGTSPT